MTKQELAAACDRLGAYFGKTIPPVQLDEWFRLLRHRDGGQALESAVDRVLVECDSIPRNVPKALAGYIADWKAEHPARSATGQRENCPHCWMGSGFIYAYRNGALSVDMRFRYAVPCGHCRPAARGAMTVQQIDALGYWIDAPRTGADIYHHLADDGLADRLARMVPALARSKAAHPGRAA